MLHYITQIDKWTETNVTVLLLYVYMYFDQNIKVYFWSSKTSLDKPSPWELTKLTSVSLFPLQIGNPVTHSDGNGDLRWIEREIQRSLSFPLSVLSLHLFHSFRYLLSMREEPLCILQLRHEIWHPRWKGKEVSNGIR